MARKCHLQFGDKLLGGAAGRPDRRRQAPGGRVKRNPLSEPASDKMTIAALEAVLKVLP